MKFKVSKAALVAAVNKAERAVPSRSTIPALEYMLVGADADGAFVAATSIDMTIHAPVADAVVTTRGLGAISARMFRDVVAKLPDGDVTVAVDETFHAAITSGRVKLQVPGIDPAQYPTTPDVEGDTFAMDVEGLREAVDKCAFAARSAGDMKFRTIHVETGDAVPEGMRLTALDGHRIAIRTAEVPKDFQEVPDADILVPVQDMSEAVKALPKEGVARVTFDKNRIRLAADDGTEVTCALVAGTYVNVARLTAMDMKTSMTINRDEMVAALDRASLFVRENDKVPVLLESGDGHVTVSINSVLGTGEESLDAVVKGEPIKIGFNVRLLIDALRASDDEEVTMEFASPKSPCAIRGHGYEHYVLPVNIVGR